MPASNRSADGPVLSWSDPHTSERGSQEPRRTVWPRTFSGTALSWPGVADPFAHEDFQFVSCKCPVVLALRPPSGSLPAWCRTMFWVLPVPRDACTGRQRAAALGYVLPVKYCGPPSGPGGRHPETVATARPPLRDQCATERVARRLVSRNVTGTGNLTIERSSTHCMLNYFKKISRSRRIESGWIGMTTRRLLCELDFWP